MNDHTQASLGVLAPLVLDEEDAARSINIVKTEKDTRECTTTRSEWVGLHALSDVRCGDRPLPFAHAELKHAHTAVKI